MKNIIFVGLGGFIGASLRYIISGQASKYLGNHLPYGTLIVNILGGFLIAIILELSLSTNLVSSNMKLFLTTGLLGGLTTFSTFSYETISIFATGNYIIGSLNVCLNLFLSLFGVCTGRFLIHHFIN